MNDAHFAGTATMLTNGFVLIVGGENNGQYPIAGAELYDPSSGTWTNTGALQQEREAFASARLPDGRVLVVGGYDGGGAGEISSAEIYDPHTETWTNAAPMHFAADSQTATLLPDGTVLVAGGSNNGNALTNAILYSPLNNTWTNTGSLQVARAGHAAILLPSGKVLVVGGGGNSAELYDPSAGEWTLVASMNDGRSYPSATLLPDGQVLVLGGDPGQTSAELYNPTNDTWTYTGSLNVGRLFHTATLVAGGQVVVAGGDAGTIGYYNGPPMANVETYNQATQNISFGFALNTTNLVWTTSGDTSWFVESTNTHDNVAAAQSGAIGDSHQSSLQTTVTGPGTLTFWWQVSSETNYDFLEFDLDGISQDKISGTGLGWAQKTYSIPSGTHGLQWLYSKDASGSDGFDAGFLDQVSYTSTAPSLIVTASPKSGPEPLTVHFTCPSVDSDGNNVTNWNWNFGDGGTSMSQNPSHTYGNLGSYTPSLVVQSAAGAVPVITGPGAITVTLSESAFLTNLPGTPAAFTFHNFANAKSLQFNGSAAKATNSDGAVLELTKSGSAQAGSAFSGNPLSFTHNVGFSTFFVFRLGNPALGSPGDGITFTIQSDSPFALGNGGAGDSGIKKSLNVEFDAFKNGTQSTTPGGINANQAAIATNGAASALVAVPVMDVMNNGNLWYAWIDYEGVSQDLEVRLSEVPVRPRAPTLETTVNLPAILGVTNALTTGGTQSSNLLANGGFESEPNWGGGVYYDGSATALVGGELPGWTIEPNHAVTIHKSGGPYLTISGGYSVNTDGEGYHGNNANLYQDFASTANSSYTLRFNWQSWGQYGTPTTSKQAVSVMDTVTGAVLFNGLYAYDGNGPHPVHAVTANFQGTGNPLRLRIQESPQSGYNDNTFMVDDFSVTSSPKYANAYVGFTGAGGNQQDILAWKFMPLPTTRITGTFKLTNVPPGFRITNGIVLARYKYSVAGTIYTNYNYVPIDTISNLNSKFAFATKMAELNKASALPNMDAVDLALKTNAAAIDAKDFMTYAVLATYENADLNTEGAVINTYNDGTGYPEFLHNAEFNTRYPIYEDNYLNIMYQNNQNPIPGLYPPPDLLTMADVGAYFGGMSAQMWSYPDQNGDFNNWTTLYSLGQEGGTMTARQQVVDSPPLLSNILSPRSDGTNFVFNFGTVSNQSYTVWGNSNLATTNWVSYTNLIGDGYVQIITAPLTNSTQSFYQLSSP
jgi:PKD repeat protein